jgi:uncharacterized protein (DUF433 family)
MMDLDPAAGSPAQNSGETAGVGTPPAPGSLTGEVRRWLRSCATKGALRSTLHLFDYEDGLALRWHPRGRGSPILVDPRIAFGAPMIADSGVPTSVIRDRFKAGETLAEIEDDFDIPRAQVEEALAFEGVPVHTAA